MTQIELEETVAHLLRAVEELSTEVARQGAALEGVSRRVQMLLERAAQAESDGGRVILGDERPPHY